MKTLCILALLVAATSAQAQQSRQERIYDSSGRSLGTATTTGNTTVIRDASGRTTGTATTTGNTTNFYDPSGRRTGSTVADPRR